MTHARTKYVVLFWWFLLLGAHPIRVGPFYDVSECDAIRDQIPAAYTITTCWSDTFEPKNTLRK